MRGRAPVAEMYTRESADAASQRVGTRPGICMLYFVRHAMLPATYYFVPGQDVDAAGSRLWPDAHAQRIWNVCLSFPRMRFAVAAAAGSLPAGAEPPSTQRSQPSNGCQAGREQRDDAWHGWHHTTPHRTGQASKQASSLPRVSRQPERNTYGDWTSNGTWTWSMTRRGVKLCVDWIDVKREHFTEPNDSMETTAAGAMYQICAGAAHRSHIVQDNSGAPSRRKPGCWEDDVTVERRTASSSPRLQLLLLVLAPGPRTSKALGLPQRFLEAAGTEAAWAGCAPSGVAPARQQCAHTRLSLWWRESGIELAVESQAAAITTKGEGLRMQMLVDAPPNITSHHQLRSNTHRQAPRPPCKRGGGMDGLEKVRWRALEGRARWMDGWSLLSREYVCLEAADDGALASMDRYCWRTERLFLAFAFVRSASPHMASCLEMGRWAASAERLEELRPSMPCHGVLSTRGEGACNGRKKESEPRRRRSDGSQDAISRRVA
ncbi:hypothetical protein Purlil1_6558 [Purpureocillium lilacinum]|uniref:Uncharacterized protein n=1 Tax=Purpureocillium lilacinum TaxID=33203 RepID=A0ABR0BYT4_PURLI|nr:hypothetical protein Purlil1_6558 [Purpureocillium lilacinum]